MNQKYLLFKNNCIVLWRNRQLIHRAYQYNAVFNLDINEVVLGFDKKKSLSVKQIMIYWISFNLFDLLSRIGSVVLGVGSVTQRLLVWGPLWSLNGVCCVLTQGILYCLNLPRCNWVPVYAGVQPAMDWCPILGESMILIHLAPQKPEICAFMSLRRN